MKWFTTAFILLFMSSSIIAAKTLTYHAYDEKTHEVTGEFSRVFEELPSGNTHVRVEWKGSDGVGTALYVLSADYGMVRWEMSRPAIGTEYVAERNGNELLVQGSIKGKNLQKRVKLDKHPLYFNPSICLQAFARSDKDEREFRVLHPEKFSTYKMKAEKKGVETVTVNGQQFEAIRVKWRLTGLMSRLYSQTDWYRRSDGVYLKSQPSDGEYHKLIQEE